jgi:hypothetical protein
MARPKSEKKSEPTAPAERRVLPMELQVGDRLTDETGEWEIVSRPYTSNAGKDVHVRVKRVDNAEVTVIRTWSAQDAVVSTDPCRTFLDLHRRLRLGQEHTGSGSRLERVSGLSNRDGQQRGCAACRSRRTLSMPCVQTSASGGASFRAACQKKSGRSEGTHDNRGPRRCPRSLHPRA